MTTTRARLWTSARTSILLSLLFVAVYVPTNYFASTRPDVWSIGFDWEKHTPFVPWLIFAYMSIDLFFVASPFFCRSDAERRTLAARLITATLIAGTCFLLFPFRFGLDRPAVDGWLGGLFNSFREFDRPFNELPSLHIAYGLILGNFYARRLHRPNRPWALLIVVWFLLIALSAIMTYQHHVLDALGGLIVAIVSFLLFPAPVGGVVVKRNDRVGWYYLAGAVLCVIGAFAAERIVPRPWTWVLLWPAAVFAWKAIAYFGARRGASVYGKSGGRVPPAAQVLLWPLVLGQRLSLMHYARQCRPWDVLTEQVWIGRVLSEPEARDAMSQGVIAVLDLTEEFSEGTALRKLPYLNVPILDLTAPTDAQLDEAVAFITRHAERGIVYVHCKIGYSRTAAVAGACLLRTRRARSAAEALEMLRAARPSIVIRPEAVRALRQYESRLRTGDAQRLASGETCGVGDSAALAPES